VTYSTIDVVTLLTPFNQSISLLQHSRRNPIAVNLPNTASPGIVGPIREPSAKPGIASRHLKVSSVEIEAHGNCSLNRIPRGPSIGEEMTDMLGLKLWLVIHVWEHLDWRLGSFLSTKTRQREYCGGTQKKNREKISEHDDVLVVDEGHVLAANAF
jgi:hypothetical protein